ncbi:MAG: TIM barrel protein [Candidatus Pacearchaeota archaeon]|jgi:deoxyribonuclease-4|nr:endonuclease IV [Candidatus Pacearchaeota archaeon]MDP7520610.1 TIM barrel protein [Candidatus Pacearchaeota archaeon]|tara:strand:- start:6056 stop:6838 length:783 start_codon:yes stop_codon:yes gene_type:complete
MSIKFGPAGLGPVNEAISNLEEYHKLGFKACEIAFTYVIYIKKKEDALKIGKAAKKFDIQLSIHAPYWINLNSVDKEKIEKSKQRILKCCEIGTYLGAKRVVFHPGYYGKMDKDETYENIKREIIDIQKIIKQKKYTPKLAPETTGKINVFGSIDEIKKLSQETKISFCIDFAHILARYKNYNFKEILKKFKNYKDIHIHFSGIEYGEKGEKHHKLTPEIEIEKLISNLPKNLDITVINESPDTIGDSIKTIEIYRGQEQ